MRPRCQIADDSLELIAASSQQAVQKQNRRGSYFSGARLVCFLILNLLAIVLRVVAAKASASLNAEPWVPQVRQVPQALAELTGRLSPS
jgi:hypothetical protein